MTWRRVAIGVCATVATLAGAVSLTAAALGGDQDSAPPPGPARTITVDRLTASCPPRSDATAGEPDPQPSCDG